MEFVMQHAPVLPVLVPLTVTILMLLFFRDDVRWQRIMSIGSAIALLMVATILLVKVNSEVVTVYWLGNWRPPFGIVLMVDRLSVIMLYLCAITGLASLIFACGELDERRERTHFHPLFQLLMMGINGAFVTGDLFNLFVFYEILLAASYGLLVLGNEPYQLRAAIQYLVLNLVKSTLFLFSVACLYGVLGTVNMAHLSQRIAMLDNGSQKILVEAAGFVLLTVFSIKAALVPLFFWMPDSYPAPSASVGAMFAGMMTKVGVYSLARVFPLVFHGSESWAGSWVLPIAAITMVGGVLGAVAQTNFRRLLSFHITSQVGYMVMGIGLFTPFGIGAAIFYIAHHILVKAGLFLIAGIAERMSGEKDIREMGRLIRHPVTAGLFLIAGWSLAGVPPLSGFWAKLFVIKEGLHLHAYYAVFAALLTGLLTLFSMTKVWVTAFWGGEPKRLRQVPVAMVVGAILLVSFSVIIPIVAEPVWRYCELAGTHVTNPEIYIKAVLGSEDIMANSQF
ncbi:MAG: Na+/H+ antiporter subunit D [Armatimonadetes bacterium]|nr:Na+/H+ antiporter subunit D [Armatimonadota bacterium]MDW8029139.1 proton-conducting transporter membrane subunit [Armatimonadota bacterium]